MAEPEPFQRPRADETREDLRALLDQLRALPDDIRDAVLSGLEGSRRVDMPGLDVLLDVLRTQDVSADDFRQSLASPAWMPRATFDPSAIAGAPADLPARDPLDLVGGTQYVDPLADHPSRSTRPELLLENLDYELARPIDSLDALAQAARGAAQGLSDASGLFEPGAGRPTYPVGSGSLADPLSGLSSTPRRYESDASALFGMAPRRAEAQLPTPVGASDPRYLFDPVPDRKQPGLDQLLDAVLQMAPRPVAQGFSEALRQTQGWKRVGESFESLADNVGFVRLAAGLGAALPALLPLSIALGTAYGAQRMVSRFNDEAIAQSESNRQLSRYNAGAATSFAMLDLGAVRRTIDAGEQLEKSIVALNGQVNRMNDAWQDFNVLRQDLANRGATFKAGFMTGAGNAVAPVAQAGMDVLNQLDPEADLAGKVGEFLGRQAVDAGLRIIHPMLPMALQNLQLLNGNGAQPQQPYMPNWTQELLNISQGAHVQRAGLVNQIRPGMAIAGAAIMGGQGPVGARAARPIQQRLGPGNRNLMHPAAQGAMQWNAARGLPPIILP